MADKEDTCLGSDQYLNSAGLEQTLNNPLVLGVQSLMEITNAVLESLHKASIMDMIEMRLQIFKLNVQKLVGFVVSRTMR